MKKIAVIHLEPMTKIGGGENIFFETSKILNEKYNVTAYHPTTFDVGNNLEGIESIGIKSPFKLNKIGRGYKLKEWITRRKCKNILKNESWDLIFSTGSYFKYREDISTINYFHFGTKKKWTNPYAKIFGHHQIRENFDNLRLVCNSKKTRNEITEKYDIDKDDIEVIYPPVKNDFKKKNWSEREDGFACVGRIAPHKKQLETIKIIQNIDKKHLHIIGRVSDKKYLRKIKNIAGEETKFHINVPQKLLEKLLTNHKYAISLSNESFGIAVAEYLNAGCIPFVHEVGAQTEIVNDKRLQCNKDNAERKIKEVLNNKSAKMKLKEKMHNRIGKFSKETFREKVMNLVKETLS